MPQTTTYGYDAHGNIVKKTMPNGETITQTYDALNRVTKIEGQKPSSGGLLYRYGYRYDLAGNIVHIREDYSESPASWREIQQTYDRAHRLVSEQYTYSPDGILGTDEGNRIISYRYDEADNRTQKSIFRFSEQEDYTYNNLNQLEHLGTDERSVDYEYDLNGNRILRTEDTTITGYAYDYDNRLVAVTNNTLEPAYAYNYDYRTRRVGILAAPDTGSPATTTLSFSGGTSVQEYTDSTLNVEYIRGSDLGGGIGGILYTIRGGDPSFTHYNSRGDVVAKTNAANTLTYQAAYEAYGTRSDESGSTLDRQKANTKDEDPTGLLNEGFRYRDLETGEFITRDPEGFVDGPNLYTYVRQNPWTKFDPKGLQGLIVKPSDVGGSTLDDLIWIAKGGANAIKEMGNAAAKTMTQSMGDVSPTVDIVSNNPLQGAIANVPTNLMPTLATPLDTVVAGLEESQRLVQGSPLTKEGAAKLTLAGLVVAGTLVRTNPEQPSPENAENKGNFLVRFGPGPESPEQLAEDAARAEAGGFPHGVSTMQRDRISGSDKQHRSAPKSEVEKVFPVEQTGRNPKHHTVFLPKPVDKEAADKFNKVFPPKPQKPKN